MVNAVNTSRHAPVKRAGAADQMFGPLKSDQFEAPDVGAPETTPRTASEYGHVHAPLALGFRLSSCRRVASART